MQVEGDLYFVIFEVLIRELFFVCFNIDEIDYFYCVVRFKVKVMVVVI